MQKTKQFFDQYANEMREQVIALLSAKRPVGDGCGKVTIKMGPEKSPFCYNLPPTEPKWIHVTERFPEEDTRVLVWLVDGANQYTRMDTDRRHNSKWVRWEKYVTHWMPLPEPPKE